MLWIDLAGVGFIERDSKVNSHSNMKYLTYTVFCNGAVSHKCTVQDDKSASIGSLNSWEQCQQGAFCPLDTYEADRNLKDFWRITEAVKDFWRKHGYESSHLSWQFWK